MFSKELEALIEATLADGVLEDNEKAALVKRAQAEGVDLGELEIYINSIMQKRMQTKTAEEEARDNAAAAAKKEAVGRTCPHCGTVIPPLAEQCPGCGEWIMTASLNDRLEKDFETVRLDLASALNQDSWDEKLAGLEKVKVKIIEMQVRYSSIGKVQKFCDIMLKQCEESIANVKGSKKKVLTIVGIILGIAFSIALIAGLLNL